MMEMYRGEATGTYGAVGRSTCDSCGAERCTGTMHHHLGTPVLFQCAACDPRSFWRAFRDAVRWIFLPHKEVEAA